MRRTIEVDEDVYRFLVKNTRELGESASDILRRLLDIPARDEEKGRAATAERGSSPASAEAPPAPRSAGPAEEASAPAEKASVPEAEPSAPEKKASAPEKEASAPEAKASAPEKKASAPEAKSSAPAASPGGTKKRKKRRRKAPSPPADTVPETKKTQARDPKTRPGSGAKESSADASGGRATLAEFLDSPTIKKATGPTRYLEILGFLAREHPDAFPKILGMSGRPGCYFAQTKREIEESGRSTRPQQIPNTTYWALGDLDDFQRRDILKEAMELMRCDPEAVRMCVAVIR